MSKSLFYLLPCWVFTFYSLVLSAQTDVIEIDSLSRAAVKTAPFDKPFLIKAPIDAENVKRVFLVRRAGHRSLSESITWYVSKGSGTYMVPELEPNYFWTRKIGEKNYLFISIADQYLFKPSESYFLLPDLQQTDPAALSFFDAYYQYSLGGAGAASALADARQHLSRFQQKMEKIFGTSLVFGFATVPLFNASLIPFAASFTAYLQPTYTAYAAAKVAFIAGLPARIAVLNGAWPVFAPLIQQQLKVDNTLNKEAIAYLMGKDLQKNDMASDITAAQGAGLASMLLTGEVGLHCLRCAPVDVNANTVKELSRRVANIDSSIRYLVQLQRSLNLLIPTGVASIPISIVLINTWIGQLQLSRTQLESMIGQRRAIEANIMDEYYAGMGFTYTQVLGGNTYLNFETRNKVLLTPDFGIVTPALTREGKNLEYGIVPYLGFHINLMAVDKDIAFKSYRKHPLQRLSVMVGWSLVDMNKDKEYANFFEKSALLTGGGFRLSNVIRFTAGTQWLFRLGTSTTGEPTRTLKALPFVGLSFDLNVKQYLNGFVDLLSGIGKTKTIPPPTLQTVVPQPAAQQ